MPDSDFLQMRGINKSFDGTQALREVDFSALAGEVHAISGENGAGKSTLVKILSGALQRDAGEVLLGGVPVELGTPVRARRLGVHAVYQEFSLVPHLTVAENILMGEMPGGGVLGLVDWARAYRRAEEILQEIGFVGIDVRKRVRQLSVSHQQMVEIAKAVAVRPRILILDEPSAVLSQEELDRLFALVRQLRQESTLILYISHRLDEVFEIADRLGGQGVVVQLRGGPADNSIGLNRSNGMLSVVQSYPGMSVVTAPDWGGWSSDGGITMMEDMLAANPQIDAVFCENDSMCLGAQQAIADAGRTDEMFLVGVDGEDAALLAIMNGTNYAATGLNSSDQIGRAAFHRLMAILAGAIPPTDTFLPSPLITIDNVARFYNPEGTF